MKYLRRYSGSICGCGVGILAIAIWISTFDPHGGVELSRYLFPFSAAILNLIYPEQSVPVLLWYTGAFLQWVFIGVIVDVVRNCFRK